MADTVFGRMGYSFDDTLYGEDFALTENGKKTLKAQTDNMALEAWQIYDIASGDAGTRTNYYKNPHATVCSTIRATANLILTVANTYAFSNATNSQNNMITSATNLIIEIDKFKSHTDNVSGVSNPATFTNPDARLYPTLDSASGIGQALLPLVNKTDDVANCSPMMGSMTSLFIGADLDSNDAILAADWVILNTTLSVASTDDGMGGYIMTYASNVSPEVANTIILHLDTATTLVNTRRTHDWNFFQQATTTLQYHGQMKRLGTMGKVEANLVINLIGTDRLTANL